MTKLGFVFRKRGEDLRLQMIHSMVNIFFVLYLYRFIWSRVRMGRDYQNISKKLAERRFSRILGFESLDLEEGGPEELQLGAELLEINILVIVLREGEENRLSTVIFSIEKQKGQIIHWALRWARRFSARVLLSLSMTSIYLVCSLSRLNIRSCDPLYFDLINIPVGSGQRFKALKNEIFYDLRFKHRIPTETILIKILANNHICSLPFPQMSNVKCEICFEFFNETVHCPRVCIHCGHSVCEKCLVDIRYAAKNTKCPFCKNQSPEMWPRNHTLLSSISISSPATSNICTAHKRKATNMCTHTQCKVPVMICDLADCFKLHLDKGLDNIPLSLVIENESVQENKERSAYRWIDNYYTLFIRNSVKIMNEFKNEALAKYFGSPRFAISQECLATIDKIKTFNSSSITAEESGKLKKEILTSEKPDREDDIPSIKRFIDEQQKHLIEALLSGLPSLEECRFINQEDLLIKQISSSRKKDSAPLALELRLVSQVLDRKFEPCLLFDSNVHSKSLYLSRLRGSANLVFNIQLQDGMVIGVYMKRTYVNPGLEEKRVIDQQAFVYLLNTKRVFKASKESVAQYDYSNGYLLSVGNTGNYDGFWIKDSLTDLNPGQREKQKHMVISHQYMDMRFQISTQKIKQFKVYQLDFFE